MLEKDHVKKELVRWWVVLKRFVMQIGCGQQYGILALCAPFSVNMVGQLSTTPLWWHIACDAFQAFVKVVELYCMYLFNDIADWHNDMISLDGLYAGTMAR